MKNIYLLVFIMFLSSGTFCQVSKSINVTSEGFLYSYLTKIEKETVTNLVINGTINAVDFYTMRDSLPKLINLDLSNAIVKDNVIPQRALEFSDIEIIELPQNIITIGKYAFHYTKLKSITLPDSLRTIMDYAFLYTSISNITLNKSIIQLGKSVFPFFCNFNVDINNPVFSSIDGVLFSKDKSKLLRCPSDKTGEYIIPSTVTSIEEYGFDFCSLQSVIIPNSVTTICGYAFEGSKSLSSISFSENLETIGEQAFFSCDMLDSIVLPQSLKYIGEGAFMYCKVLTSITIPSSVTFLGNNVFDSCYLLENVTIGTGLTFIPDYCFNLCKKLSNISLGQNIKTINYAAFLNCKSLDSLYIPASVTSINDLPLKTYTYVDVANKDYSSTNGILFNKNKTTLYKFISKNLKEYTIPSTVTYIDNGAFVNCNLETLIIPSSVKLIKYYAFSSCPKLKKIYSYAVSVPQQSGACNIFYKINDSCVLYVKSKALDNYKLDNQWNKFYKIEAMNYELSTNELIIEPLYIKSDSIKVTSNIPYTLSTKDEWLTINVPLLTFGVNYITFSASNNISQNDRTATVNIIFNDTTETITVTQKASKTEVLAIKENNTSEHYISIYDNYIHINTKQEGIAKIFDVNGKIVFYEKTNTEIVISLNQFSKGIYFVQLYTDDKLFSKKVIL